MLGAQDFCGYYDWTFSYLRQHIDPGAAHRLWAEAISKAQQHYTDAGRAHGLRGLYETWVHTGEDEHCDWTFTLDEKKNVLRWDMRQCPSKGHLIENDLYADEDYCDHCMGWIKPVLEAIGGEMVVHEHNHCGQCWGEMRLNDKPYESLAGLECDITHDPRWQRGFIERWERNVKLPLLEQVSASSDPVDVVRAWFAQDTAITVLGRGPSAADHWTRQQDLRGVIVTDPTYATRDVYGGEPRGVVIGDHSQVLAQIAERFHVTPKEKRPLLMHPFLPGAPMQAFAAHGLPRPVPILPLLVRVGLYRHEPFAPYPTTGVFALLLAAALEKRVTVAGIDLYRHPSGRAYTNDQPHRSLPKQHDESCDLAHIQAALDRLGDRVTVHPFLQSLLMARRG